MSEKLPLEKKKQTGDQKVDGLAPKLFKNWKTLDFKNCIEQSPGIKCKLKKTKIKNIGKVPVIDQGENFIAGYTDDKATIYNCSLPIIIFGDHTRHIKFVDIEFAVGADGTKIIKPKKYYDIRFFYHYLNSLNWQHCGYGRHYKYLKQLEVPLPPLNEQKLIVAKLDQIMPKIDGVKERLERIPQIIKHFRQSVLTAAVTGKLTEKWRDEHPEVESAEVLLERIKDNKTKKKKDKLRNLPYELPENWLISGFYDIAEIKTNLVNPKGYQEYPHIAPDNIEKETGKLLPYKTVREDKVTSPKHLFFKGQIVYSKIRPYLSKAIIAEFNGLCSADMYPIESKIDSKYLFYYILSNTFLNFASNSGTRSVLPKINQTEIGRIPFPLPPTEEQKEIVRHVDKLFAFANKLEDHYKNAKEKVAKFPQSVLAKAFRGELVPQDPNDEPAEKLLKRIKEEKARLEAEFKKEKKKFGISRRKAKRS